MLEQKFRLGDEVFILDPDQDHDKRTGVVTQASLASSKGEEQFLVYEVRTGNDPNTYDYVDNLRDTAIIPKGIVDEHVAHLLVSEDYVKASEIPEKAPDIVLAEGNALLKIVVDQGDQVLGPTIVQSRNAQEVIEFLLKRINKDDWDETEADPSQDDLVLVVSDLHGEPMDEVESREAQDVADALAKKIVEEESIRPTDVNH